MSWNLIGDDNFTNAPAIGSRSATYPTSTGGAGSTSGVLNGWIDLNGGKWNLPSSGTAHDAASASPDYSTTQLVRPSSEDAADSRIVWTRPADSNIFVGWLRYNRSTNHGYFAYTDGTTLRLVRYDGTLNVLNSVGYTVGTNTTLTMDFNVTGTTLSVTLSYSGGSGGDGGHTITATDSNYASGSYAFSANSPADVNHAQWYNTAAFTISPPTLPSNHLGNITATLSGTGTSWVNGTTTMTASGVAGWSVVSTTVSSATAATIVLSGPTSATPPAGATGTLTLTEGGTGANTSTTGVATPTLAISPTSGNTGTTPTLTLTGANTLWTTETAAGLFTESGGTGASIGTPTVTTNAAATATLTVGSASGTLTITDHSTGATASFTASTPAVTVAVNDIGLFWSPYTWRINGTSWAQSANPGAYVYLKFTTLASGTITLNVDVSPLTGASVSAGSYPSIRYRIDNGTWTDHKLTSSDSALSLATGLSAATHVLELFVLNADQSVDRWTTPVEVVRINSFTLSGGSTTSSPTLRSKRMVVFGDSITEGIYTTAASVPSGGDSTANFTVGLAAALSAEYGQIGFGGQGWTISGQGNVPTFPLAWDHYSSGQSRLSAGLLSPAPDYIVALHGTNDGLQGASDASVTTAVTSWIAAARTAAPSAKIFVFAPPGEFKSSAISAGVTAAADANTYFIDMGSELAAGLSGPQGTPTFRSPADGIHPDTRCHGEIGARMAQAIQSQSGGGSVRLINGGLVAA